MRRNSLVRLQHTQEMDIAKHNYRSSLTSSRMLISQLKILLVTGKTYTPLIRFINRARAGLAYSISQPVLLNLIEDLNQPAEFLIK
ncbi:MAG: hypothetical protein ACI9C9_002676 [Marivirga sp.]|jgi:hypothetical protein